MPSLVTIPILGNVLFLAQGLKLPTSASWKQPSGDPDANQYVDGIGPSKMMGIPTVIPPWFLPQNPHKYHVDACDTIGKAFKELHDTMIDAVKFAHDLWRLQAKFKNLQIMAVCAIGGPGCLDGPALESNIKMAPPCAAWTGNKAKYRDAVAAGVSKAFKNWQDNVMVPGLPWYPAFAAFPGPQAPPMPNIPTPLIACPSTMMADICAPMAMKQGMIDALDAGLKNEDKDKQHEALFLSIATVLSLAFTVWLASQQVMLVLGKGPIPSFAPPFVPVGPVVAGDIISAPGHLIA